MEEASCKKECENSDKCAECYSGHLWKRRPLSAEELEVKMGDGKACWLRDSVSQNIIEYTILACAQWPKDRYDKVRLLNILRAARKDVKCYIDENGERDNFPELALVCDQMDCVLEDYKEG